MTKSVCVFCGSRDGQISIYAEQAEKLGKSLAERGWRLVYGAGDVGLMGRVARAAQAAGGETFGVIPEHLLQREVGKRDLTQFVVTQTMHERKKVMFMNADAILVLPGGAGTLDEFFEVLTWRQLGLHDKPIVVVDTGGFWAPLRALLKAVVESGFADQSLSDMMAVAGDSDAALDLLDRASDPRDRPGRKGDPGPT